MSPLVPSAEGPLHPVGVAVCDLTPAEGPRWGRMRGLVWALGEGSGLVVVCAVDAPCARSVLRDELAEAAGLPVERLVLLPGGAARADWAPSALVPAIRQACADRQPAHLRLGRASAWELLRPASVGHLLAGRRLERSRRQLANRAPDERLEALALALNDGAVPPGGPWRDRLVDARVHAWSVWAPGRDAPRSVLAIVGGGDAFDGGPRWATAGARGHAARLLGGRKGFEGTVVQVARMASDARTLGAVGRDIVARDPEEARQRDEKAGAALVRALDAAVSASGPVSDWSVGWHHGRPANVDDNSVHIGVLTLGGARLLSVPGRVSDALRVDLTGDGPAFIPIGPVGGELGCFQTVREATLSDEADRASHWGPEQGRWLRSALSDLQTPDGSVDLPSAAGVEVVSRSDEEAPMARHLSLRVRMGRGDAQGVRQLTLDARLRLLDGTEVSAPGVDWQVRLEWAHPKNGWVPAMLGGVPVDDVHQGMRSRRFSGAGGDELHLRWSVPEPRRWKGRQLRLRVGPAWGGPLVSAPVRVG